MGKTRVLFKKIRDTKGMFHAKMGSIKDRNNMDLTEAEYTEELYKKDHDPDDHDGVIIQICESASRILFKKTILSFLIIKFCE